MPEKTLRQRIDCAIDVSAAMDNCFFHSFVLHLIANNQSFPEGLFDSHPLDGDELLQLKKTFKPYERQLTQSSDFLFENTLVLGALLRGWFMNQLIENNANKEAVFNRFMLNVTRAKAIYEENSTEGIIKQLELAFSGQENSDMPFDEASRLGNLESMLFDDSYIPNESIALRLEAIKAKISELGGNVSHIQAQNPAGQLELVFGEDNLYLSNKDFFNGMHGVNLGDADTINDYWNTTGYKNYCTYLAKPGIKIAFEEVKPVLDLNEFAYTVFDKATAVQAEVSDSLTVHPRFEIALAPGEGHYFLLTTPDTEELLKTYSTAFSTYKAEQQRVMLLAGSNEKKIQECMVSPAILLAAILPASAAYNPFDLLIKSLPRLATIYSSKAALDKLHEPTEIKPEPSEIQPKPPEIGPEPTEIGPKPTEIGPKPTEIEPEPTEIVPKPPEIAPKPPEIAPKPPEIAPEPAETGSKPAKIRSKVPDEPVDQLNTSGRLSPNTSQLTLELLDSLKSAVENAQQNYAKHYKNHNLSKRGNSGWFSWFRHGKTGQDNARKFYEQNISGKQTEEEVIQQLVGFFNGKNAHYHRHSFASYLLDELSTVMGIKPNDLYSPTAWKDCLSEKINPELLENQASSSNKIK